MVAGQKDMVSGIALVTSVSSGCRYACILCRERVITEMSVSSSIQEHIGVGGMVQHQTEAEEELVLTLLLRYGLQAEV